MNTPIPPVTAPATEALKPLPINTDNIPLAPPAGKKPEPEKICLADKFGGTVQKLHDAGPWGQLVNIFLVPFGAAGVYQDGTKDCPSN